jgi:hypothetical protein
MLVLNMRLSHPFKEERNWMRSLQETVNFAARELARLPNKSPFIMSKRRVKR